MDGRTLNNSVFFFNDTATTEIYPLSLHDALPISGSTFNLNNDRGIFNFGGTASTFNNAGTFNRGTTTGMATVNIAFNNSSTDNWTTVTRLLPIPSTPSNSFVVATGSTLDFGGFAI